MTIPAIPQQADTTKKKKIKITVGRVKGAGFVCVSPSSLLQSQGGATEEKEEVNSVFSSS